MADRATILMQMRRDLDRKIEEQRKAAADSTRAEEKAKRERYGTTEREKAGWRVSTQNWPPSDPRYGVIPWVGSGVDKADSTILGILTKPQKPDPSAALIDSTAAWQMIVANPNASPEEKKAAEEKLRAVKSAGKEPERVTLRDSLKAATDLFRLRALAKYQQGGKLTKEEMLAIPSTQRPEQKKPQRAEGIVEAMSRYAQKIGAAKRNISEKALERFSGDDTEEGKDRERNYVAAQRKIATAYAESLKYSMLGKELGFANMYGPGSLMERKAVVKDRIAEYKRIEQTQGTAAAQKWLSAISGGKDSIDDLIDWQNELTIGDK